MPVSKKQQACVSRYMSTHYAQFSFRVPKSDGDEIRKSAAAAGESVNGYIAAAVTQRMERDAADAADAAASPDDTA